MRRGPSRRASHAVMRARIDGEYAGSGAADEARHFSAWPSAALASARNSAAIFASGSLSHRFAQNGTEDEYAFRIWDEFLEQNDRHALELWNRGDWKAFTRMLPAYAEKCYGEGFMHDTAMLLGALGWDHYDQPVEVITPYFGSSGTGQINAIFPVTPLAA